MAQVGIIGGSGLYALDGLETVREIQVETPFGAPSSRLITGRLGGLELVFVPRHGRGHVLMPTEVPYRANIYALKTLGVQWVISVSAVGSMREEIEPGHMVLPHQFIDRTRGRPQTFFGGGLVAHVSMADPVCDTLRGCLAEAVTGAGVPCHRGGTYVCMEGPAFSTRAESNTYRHWNVDVIGMTGLPEAKLAREAELHYATIALATDYDCWHESEEAVSTEAVLAVLRQNTENVKRVLAGALPRIQELTSDQCGCARALQNAILTDPAHISPEARERLAPLVDKYL